MFSNKMKLHTDSYPLSISARLMYNPDVMKWFIPPCIKEPGDQVEVNEWTG